MSTSIYVHSLYAAFTSRRRGRLSPKVPETQWRRANT